MPPDASYGGSLLGPEDIDVSVEFKNGAPNTLFVKNMTLAEPSLHLSVLTALLQMVNDSYVEKFMKFYKASKKHAKYDNRESLTEGSVLANFDYSGKTKKFACRFFLQMK